MPTTEKIIIKADDRTKKAFASIKSNLGGLAAAVAAVISVRAIGGMIKSTIDMGDKLQKLNLTTGASVEALSEYQHVAELSGVTFNTLTTAWQRQTRRVSEAAQGTGVAKKALEELGIPIENLINLKPEKQFEIISDKLSKVASEGDRVRLAMQFWDTEGVQLLRITNQGSDALEKMKQEAHDFGKVISQETADKMADFKDETVKARSALDGLLLSFLDTGALDAFTKSIKATSFVVKFLREEFDEFLRAKHQNEFIFISEEITKTANQISLLTVKLQQMDFKTELDFDDALFAVGELRTELSALIKKRELIKNVFEDETPQKNMKEAEVQTKALTITTSAYQKAMDKLKETFIDQDGPLTAYKQHLKDLQEALELTAEPLDMFEKKILLQKELFDTGVIGMEQYSRGLDLIVNGVDGIIDKNEGLKESLITLEDISITAANNIGDAFANNLAQSIVRGDSLVKTMGAAVESIGTDLIASLIKLGAQNIILGNVSGATALKTAATTAASMNIIAASSAAAAAGVSLASFGANAGPAQAGMSSTYVLAQSLAAFEQGTDFVPKTGLALIHKGEAIIPEKENRQRRTITNNNSDTLNMSLNFTINAPDGDSVRRLFETGEVQGMILDTVRSAYISRGRSDGPPES